jgi:hypothetical protein
MHDALTGLPAPSKRAGTSACALSTHSCGSADVMYLEELVQPLVASLAAISHKDCNIYLAYGRNRQGEGAFLRACSGRFACEDVLEDQLHPIYQCIDVRVLKLSKR